MESSILILKLPIKKNLFANPWSEGQGVEEQEYTDGQGYVGKPHYRRGNMWIWKY